MSEWKNFCLGDVATFRNGKKRPLATGDIPIYGGNGILSYTNQFNFNDCVVIGRVGAYCGNVFLAKEYCWVSDNAIATLPKESVNTHFLFYLLKSLRLNTHSIGSGQPLLTQGILNELKIICPPLETQKKIAAVLSALDDKIELNNAINKNLEEQAQAIYKKICWKAKLAPLSEWIEAVESGSRPKGGATTSGIPSIGAEKIDGFGRYDYSNEKFISADYFKRLKRGIVFSGDVMLYKDGAYTGKASMALDGFPHETCAVNEHVFLLRTKDNMAQFFLYFTLRNEDGYKKIHALACGKAAQPLNQKELMCVTSFLPEEEVIQKFESIVSPLMHAIALNALENKKLGEIRDALLPRLMNGEIDVSNVEI